MLSCPWSFDPLGWISISIILFPLLKQAITIPCHNCPFERMRLTIEFNESFDYGNKGVVEGG
jgi:hypothetical protein